MAVLLSLNGFKHRLKEVLCCTPNCWIAKSMVRRGGWRGGRGAVGILAFLKKVICLIICEGMKKNVFYFILKEGILREKARYEYAISFIIFSFKAGRWPAQMNGTCRCLRAHPTPPEFLQGGSPTFCLYSAFIDTIGVSNGVISLPSCPWLFEFHLFLFVRPNRHASNHRRRNDKKKWERKTNLGGNRFDVA